MRIEKPELLSVFSGPAVRTQSSLKVVWTCECSASLKTSTVYTQKNTIYISLSLPDVLNASERISCKHGFRVYTKLPRICNKCANRQLKRKKKKLVTVFHMFKLILLF